MLFVDNQGITDPRINLAIEEYILKNMDITHMDLEDQDDRLNLEISLKIKKLLGR